MGDIVDEVKRRRLEWLTRMPPQLTNGEMRVLREMGGDFTVPQWARRMNVTMLEIERALAWLDIEAQTLADRSEARGKREWVEE